MAIPCSTPTNDVGAQPVALGARPHLVLSVYVTVAILVVVQRYPFPVLPVISIYLTTSVLISHSCIFFGEVSARILCPFFLGLFV